MFKKDSVIGYKFLQNMRKFNICIMSWVVPMVDFFCFTPKKWLLKKNLRNYKKKLNHSWIGKYTYISPMDPIWDIYIYLCIFFIYLFIYLYKTHISISHIYILVGGLNPSSGIALLGGSSHLGYVDNNHGDRKSPNWGYGTPYKWPFHGLYIGVLNYIQYLG